MLGGGGEGAQPKNRERTILRAVDTVAGASGMRLTCKEN